MGFNLVVSMVVYDVNLPDDDSKVFPPWYFHVLHAVDDWALDVSMKLTC